MNTRARGGGWVIECEVEREKNTLFVHLLCIAARNQMLLPGYRDDMPRVRW